MVTLFDLSDVFLFQNRLKKQIREKYNLSMTDYLVLATINKLEEVNGFVATSDIIEELEFNRGWVYSAINKLESKNYIEIADSKNPWTARRLSLSLGGRIRLSAIERLVGERVMV